MKRFVRKNSPTGNSPATFLCWRTCISKARSVFWSCRRLASLFILIVLLGGGGYVAAQQGWLDAVGAEMAWIPEIGEPIDELNGVAVYHNGMMFAQSHGRHVAVDGYNLGKKWQCVEFVKRYYYQHYQHKMPNVWGHARDYFKDDVAQGKLNSDRGLLQFRNGQDVLPQVGDLMVFRDSSYGHVAIVAGVDESQQTLTIVQQNIFQQPREQLTWSVLSDDYGDGYQLQGRRQPIGWLRLPD